MRKRNEEKITKEMLKTQNKNNEGARKKEKRHRKRR